MIEKLYEDVLAQEFQMSDGYYNPTRIIIFLAFIYLEEKNKVEKKEIINYLYWYYYENNDLARHSPYLSINKLGKYGLDDFIDIVNSELRDWNTYAKNKILKFDDKNVYLEFSMDDNGKDNLLRISKMILKKYFNKEFREIKKISKDEIILDYNHNKYCKERFKYFVLQDIQYCPICEECNIDKLVAIHILPSEKCNDSQLLDKNNGIIFCEKHADD